MGRAKIKKKDTFIDMTAMSDVTVLLLTFFMLTSTFVKKEPVQVTTPASVSEIKIPETDVLQILVDQEGKIFMSLSKTACISCCLSRLINIFPSGSTRIWSTFVSGILISDTEAGVVTCTGSFFTNVEVNIKKVRSNTVTSLIAVISMNVLFFLICALPMINNRFYKGSQN